MKRRPRRGLAATLTALAVLIAGSLVAVVTIQLIIGERPWIDYRTVADTLHGTRWQDTAVSYVGAGIAAIGLVLLLAAVLPGKRTVVPLAGGRPGMDSGASRRSLRSTILAAASTVDGVAHSRVRMRRRRISAVVRTNRTNPSGIDAAVRTAVDRRLDQISLVDRPDLRVRVHAPRGRT